MLAGILASASTAKASDTDTLNEYYAYQKLGHKANSQLHKLLAVKKVKGNNFWQELIIPVLTMEQNLLVNKLKRIRTRAKVKVRILFNALIPHYNAWICIHGGEGAWNSNTGNAYYGGLQMDLGFQRSYGSEFLARFNTANNWTPLIQMFVAERALRAGRGFSPWPNTARNCGLI